MLLFLFVFSIVSLITLLLLAIGEYHDRQCGKKCSEIYIPRFLLFVTLFSYLIWCILNSVK